MGKKDKQKQKQKQKQTIKIDTNVSDKDAEKEATKSSLYKLTPKTSKRLKEKADKRAALKNMTPEEREQRRLELRWQRDFRLWGDMCTRVAARFRGYRVRKITNVLIEESRLLGRSKKNILDADKYYKEGLYDESKRYIKMVLSYRPNDRNAWLISAKIYFKQKNFKMCRKCCDFIVKNPQLGYDDDIDQDVHMMRAFSLMNLKLYKEAVEDWDQLTERQPKVVTFWRQRAFCHAHLKNFSSLVHDFDLAHKVDKLSAEAFLRRGCAYACNQDWAKALADLNLALILGPNPWAYSFKARSMCCIRKWKEAKDLYKDALAMDENFKIAHSGIEDLSIPYVTLPLKIED